MKNFQRTIVLGGKGEMAGFLVPFLPTPTVLIDMKDFHKVGGTYVSDDEEESSNKVVMSASRAVRRRAAVELSAASKKGLSTLFVLSIPASVYNEAVNLPGDNHLASVIGASGRGLKETLFIHQTSVHTVPAQLLEPAAGVALRLHLMHGPRVADLSQETAIITASANKMEHDQYGAASAALKQLLRNQMKYSQVFEMSPKKHDIIMSNVQFLTHSMYLILADTIIDSKFEINEKTFDFSRMEPAVLILAGRMFKREAHVYQGIAASNSFNSTIKDKLKGLDDCRAANRQDCIRMALLQFAGIRNDMITMTSMTAKEQRWVTTPMSRARDGLISEAARHSGNDGGTVDLALREHANRYVAAVDSGYEAYFDSLKTKVNRELDKLDFENMVMKRFESRR